MKLFILILLASFNFISAQQAEDFIPPLESKWYFENTTLDSLNNPVDSLTFFSTDSVAFETNFEGRTAVAVITRESHPDAEPFIDTNYVHASGSDAWLYMKTFGAADSIDSDSLGIAAFLASFQGWYPVFRFSQAENVEYDIVKRDTTFLLDTLEVPIRIHVTGRRLADETITTPAGTFLCKKFLISPVIGIVLSPTIPPIPLINMLDTMWIAEDRWIVKNITPSSELSFSLFGGPSIFLPGSAREMITQPTSVQDNRDVVINYSLGQNYPNPFNPETRISYSLPEESYVRLSVFNSMGEKVAELFSGEKPAGNHVITFNADKFSTGVYYYRIETEKFTHTRKMILLK